MYILDWYHGLPAYKLLFLFFLSNSAIYAILMFV